MKYIWVVYRDKEGVLRSLTYQYNPLFATGIKDILTLQQVQTCVYLLQKGKYPKDMDLEQLRASIIKRACQ